MTDTEKIPLYPENNALYSTAADLHPSHWENLAARPPREAATAAGATVNAGVFHLKMLGRTLIIDPAGRSVHHEKTPDKQAGYQRALVGVALLCGAIDAPPSGKLVSPREYPGGQGFFRGPHVLPIEPIAARFAAGPEALYAAARNLGATRVDGADAAVEFYALPRVKGRVMVWGGDDELPGSAAILLDSRLHLHLALDVVWALANVIAHDLTHAAGR